jgi:predicted TIM-barrel fold metal-dependent hydrolase
MSLATVPTPNSEILSDLKIIDCDAHLTEPPDLWVSRVPASLRTRVPELRNVDGIDAWYYKDKVWASTGGNTIRTGRQKVLGTHILQPYSEIDESAYSAAHRVGLLDDMGIYAQVVYPNGIGFASNHVFAIEDEEDRTNILRTYNDFLVEFQQDSGNRVFPQALLPIWDMDLTVAEMTRLIDRGIRGFTLSDKPELLDLPELPDPYFAPMWDIFNETKAVANFHIGAGRRREELESIRWARLGKKTDAKPVNPISTYSVDPAWKYFGNQRRMAVSATQSFMSNVRIVLNLCTSDLFDRYPNLKIVSAESGIGWIPFALEALEFQLNEVVTDADEVALQKRRPREYFRDHLWVMFWFEESAPRKLLEDIGVENVLVETDVPHPTCLYPGAKEHFADVLADVGPYARQRILQDNAAELYGIPL